MEDVTDLLNRIKNQIGGEASPLGRGAEPPAECDLQHLCRRDGARAADRAGEPIQCREIYS